MSSTTSLQLLFILTNLKPTTKVSELRVDGKYSLLGQRCEMAHTRLADHQGSNWNRIAAPVLGTGVHINEQAVERIALERGWQSTWMTELVSAYAKRKARARQSTEAQGRLTFAPAPVAQSEGRVPDSVVCDSGPLPTPGQSSNPSQAADGSGAGEQGRVPIQQPLSSPQAAPISNPGSRWQPGCTKGTRQSAEG